MNWLSLRRAALAACLIGLALWGYFGMQSATTLPVGTRVADVRAELDDGRVYRLGDDPSEALVLNFWATWCGPCRREAPILSALAADGVVVIGIGIDDLPLEALHSKAREIGMHYPVGRDRTGLIQRFRVSRVPTTYVLSADGVVVFAQRGVVARQSLEAAVAEARAR